jgi:hypothetical protein
LVCFRTKTLPTFLSSWGGAGLRHAGWVPASRRDLGESEAEAAANAIVQETKRSLTQVPDAGDVVAAIARSLGWRFLTA